MPTNNAWNSTFPVSVATGGLGVSSVTAYAPIIGGTTSTNPVQSVALGASGTALMSNGAGAAPTFQTIGSIAQFGYTSGQYYLASLLNSGNTTGSTVSVANDLFLHPFYVNKNVTIDRIACRFTPITGAGNIRMCIYNQSSGLPTTVLLDCGSQAIANGTNTVTVSQALVANTFYYIGVHIENATNTFATLGGSGANFFNTYGGAAYATNFNNVYNYSSAYASGLVDLTAVSPTFTTLFSLNMQFRIA